MYYDHLDETKLEETTKIDETDMQIAEILRNDGRASNKDIAATLDISEGTVRNRIKKMADCEFLSFRGLTNLNMRMDKSYIFVFVTLQSTKRWVQIAEEVMQLPYVESVTLITGRFDLIIEVFIEPHSLLDFLTNMLPNVDGIASTETHMTIRTFNKWV
jgi:Lrp/AsnC family transcriptional regulator, regulator for asnA, asnC and gidA